MNLSELGVQYQESAAACRKRAAQLREILKNGQLSEMETLLMRRRINMLLEMAGDAAAVGKYLKNYYGRKDKHADTAVFEGDGVSEHSWLDEIFGGEGDHGEAAFHGAARGSDGAAGADGASVLHRAAHDAGHCELTADQCFHREPDARGGAEEIEALPEIQQQSVSA